MVMRPNIKPAILSGTLAERPPAYGGGVNDLYYATDVVPDGAMYIRTFDGSNTYAWQPLPAGSGNGDFPFVYLVDPKATGVAPIPPNIDPVTGRGPYPTLAQAVAQVAADRVIFATSFPAVIMVVRGQLTESVSLTENTALVAMSQEHGSIVSIVGDVTLAPTADGDYVLAGLQITGRLLWGTARVSAVTVSCCSVSVAGSATVAITNTGAGSTATFRNCTITSIAPQVALTTTCGVTCEGCVVDGAILQAADNLSLTLRSTTQTASGASVVALTLTAGSSLLLENFSCGYQYDQFAIDGPGLGSKPTIERRGAITFYPIGGTSSSGPFESARLTETIRPDRRGKHQQDLLPVSGGPRLSIASDTEVAWCTPTGGPPNAEVTIPFAATLVRGVELIVKNDGTVGLDVYAQGGETIEKQTFLPLGPGGSLRLLAQPQLPGWGQAP